MFYTCPVCGYPELKAPPTEFVICPSCGVEFEYHDSTMSHDELKRQWLRNGAMWHSKVVKEPENWSPLTQLELAGLGTGNFFQTGHTISRGETSFAPVMNIAVRVENTWVTPSIAA